MVFAPYLLPGLLELKGGEDGSALFEGRESRTFCYETGAEIFAPCPARTE